MQNKAAKLILDKAEHSSATEAINELDWLVLSERRRQHRHFFVFKCMHGLIDWNFNFTHSRETHPYNTRHKDVVIVVVIIIIIETSVLYINLGACTRIAFLNK